MDAACLRESGLDASSALARALSFVDLFVVWWIVLLGIAAAMLYGKRRRHLVCGFLGLYLVLALVTAAAIAAAAADRCRRPNPR